MMLNLIRVNFIGGLSKNPESLRFKIFIMHGEQSNSRNNGTYVLEFVKMTHHSLPKSLGRMYNRLLRAYIACKGNYPDSCMQQHVHSLKTGLRNAPLLKLLQWHQFVCTMVRVICSVHLYAHPQNLSRERGNS